MHSLYSSALYMVTCAIHGNVHEYLILGIESGTQLQVDSNSPRYVVIAAMRLHPEIISIQLASCNAFAEFMSVSHTIRAQLCDLKDTGVIIDALRVRGRAKFFDHLYLVHEMSCRALRELCQTRQSDICKKAVGNANRVELVLESIQRWLTTSEYVISSEESTSVTLHGSATVLHITYRYDKNMRHALVLPPGPM
jgi:hypothetical protein